MFSCTQHVVFLKNISRSDTGFGYLSRLSMIEIHYDAVSFECRFQTQSKGFTPVRMCGLSPLASFYYGVLTCSACPNLVQNKQFLCGVGKGGIPLKKKDYIYNDGISSSLLEIFIKMLLINSVLSYCTILMLFSRIECVHHDVTKLYNRGLLNFYIYQWGEVDLEINLFRSFQPRSVFRFENTAFLISEFSHSA